MPLLKGKKNIGRNIREMEDSGRPHDQAVAAALRTAYGPPRKRADGGHAGPLPGATGGRADEVETTVENGSHILSADCVAALGDGNTDAGYAKLMKMFPNSVPARRKGGSIDVTIPEILRMAPMPGNARTPGAPRLMAAPRIQDLGSLPHIVKPRLAAGGENEQVKVKLSHGEFGVSPRDVAEVAGGGDLERGHRALDAFQMKTRSDWIKRLKKLPGPVKD